MPAMPTGSPVGGPPTWSDLSPSAAFGGDSSNPPFDVSNAARVSLEGAGAVLKEPLSVVALGLVPMVGLVAIGIAGTFFSGAVLGLSRGGMGGIVLAALGALVTIFILCRLFGASSAATLFVLDDVAEQKSTGTGMVRPLGEAWRDGWAAGGRAFWVTVLQGITAVGGMLPAVVAALLKVSTPVLMGVVFLSGLLTAWMLLRASLALPAAVLAGESSGDAMRGSRALTNGNLVPLVVGFLILAAINSAVGAVAVALSVIPFVGWLAAMVLQLLLQGAVLGGLGRLWRLADDAS